MFKRFILKRKARRILADLFNRLDLHDISSLRPDHKSRAVFLGYEAEGDKVISIRFGLIRHPRAANVPGVFNKVIEIYSFDPEKEIVTVENSRNITKKGKPGQGSTGASPPCENRGKPTR